VFYDLENLNYSAANQILLVNCSPMFCIWVMYLLFNY